MPIRTSADVNFQFKIIRGKTFVYQLIARQAQELRERGFSWAKIAKKLGVSDKTAKEAASRTKGENSTDGIHNMTLY